MTSIADTTDTRTAKTIATPKQAAAAAGLVRSFQTTRERIESKITDLEHARDTAIAELIERLDWMDVPHLMIRPYSGTLTTGQDIEVIHFLDERSGHVSITGYPNGRHMGDRGEAKFLGKTRRGVGERHGRGTQYTYLGVWQIVTGIKDPRWNITDYLVIPANEQTD